MNYTLKEIEEMPYNGLVKLAKSIEIPFKMQKKVDLQDLVAIKLNLKEAPAPVVIEKKQPKVINPAELEAKAQEIVALSLTQEEKIDKFLEINYPKWKMARELGIKYSDLTQILTKK